MLEGTRGDTTARRARMAVLVNAYAMIGSPHTRVASCSIARHVVAVTGNDVEDDAAVGDLVVGMCYAIEGEREFGYWANDNALRFREAMGQVTSDLQGSGREPFYEYLDCDPMPATFGPESCRHLAADFATRGGVVRGQLLGFDEAFGEFYDQLAAAYAYAQPDGLVLFA